VARLRVLLSPVKAMDGLLRRQVMINTDAEIRLQVYRDSRGDIVAEYRRGVGRRRDRELFQEARGNRAETTGWNLVPRPRGSRTPSTACRHGTTCWYKSRIGRPGGWDKNGYRGVVIKRVDQAAEIT